MNTSYFVKSKKIFLCFFVVLMPTLYGVQCENEPLPLPGIAPRFEVKQDSENHLRFMFENKSINADTYSWDFGDGNTSTEKSPTHTYEEPETYPKEYTVKLTASSETSNKTSEKKVIINDPNKDSPETILAGDSDEGKTWVLRRDMKGLAVRLDGNGTDLWWSLGYEDIHQGPWDRPSLFNDEYTFTKAKAFKFDGKGDTFLDDEFAKATDADNGQDNYEESQLPDVIKEGVDYKRLLSGQYTYEYNANEKTLTLNGNGAFIAIAKATNAGYTPDPQPRTIYKVEELKAGVDGTDRVDTLILSIAFDVGADNHKWTYTLLSYHGALPDIPTDPNPPVSPKPQGEVSTIAFADGDTRFAAFDATTTFNVVANPVGTDKEKETVPFVGHIQESQEGPAYQGVEYILPAQSIGFSEKKAFTMLVHVPTHESDAAVEVTFKLEDSQGNSESIETMVPTKTGGVWETLTFDFSSVEGIDARHYDKIVVFFDVLKQNPGENFYFANIEQVTGNTHPAESFTVGITATPDEDNPLQVTFSATPEEDGTVITETEAFTYSWDFGVEGVDDDVSTEAGPTYTYATEGTYKVTLSVTDVEMNTATGEREVVVTGNTQPAESFTVEIAATPDATDPLQVTFSATFEEDGTVITETGAFTYSWNFGVEGVADDASTEAAPTYTYATEGTYKVTLSVTDVEMNTATGEREVVVTGNTQPVADFKVTITATPDDGNPLQVSFSATLEEEDGTEITETGAFTYSWNFGVEGVADDASTEAAPTYTYATEGTYKVTLSVTDVEMNTATGESSIVVMGNTQPAESFTVDITATPDATDPLQVTFSATFEDKDGTEIPATEIFTYSWDFGVEDVDDDVSTEAGPTYTYATAGNYKVTLSVEDDNNRTATGEREVEVTTGNTQPAESFTVDITATPDHTNPLQVSFSATLEEEDGTPITATETFTYSWDFGVERGVDDDVSDEATPMYTYTDAGTYRVKLSVTDDNNRTATGEQEVEVTGNTQPVADFTVTIDEPSYIPTDVHPGRVSFRSTLQNSQDGTIGDVSGYTYAWNFGDGQGTSDAQNPVYDFLGTGTFTVTLTVTRTSDGLSTTSPPKEVVIQSLQVLNDLTVVAQVSGNTVILSEIPQNQAVTFSATATTATTGGTAIMPGDYNFIWQITDSHGDDSETPTHTFTGSGMYTVSFEARNKNNPWIYGSTTVPVTVLPKEMITVSFSYKLEELDPTTNGRNIKFTSTVVNNQVSSGETDHNNYIYEWDFGFQQTRQISAEENPTQLLNNLVDLSQNTFTVTLTVTKRGDPSVTSQAQAIIAVPQPPDGVGMSEPVTIP